MGGRIVILRYAWGWRIYGRWMPRVIQIGSW
jgi:hypothetical protein